MKNSEPYQPTQFPMCILWHIWTKWENKEEGNIVRKTDSVKIGTYLVQTRTCTICNKVETRVDQVDYL